jgi:hypothetical protein
MSNDQGEAVFHAAKLLQLYDETGSVEEVTAAATALLAKRPADHVRQVRLVPSARADTGAPKQHRARMVPLRPQLGSSATPENGPEKTAAS